LHFESNEYENQQSVSLSTASGINAGRDGMAIETKPPNLDGSLARAVAWNAAARWVSQVLSWISTIVVARLLTPDDYGIIGMAGLYLNLALYVSQAGISDAIIALRDLTQRQIAALNTLALILGMGFAGLTCVVARPIAHFFSAPPLTKVLMVCSLIYVFTSFQVVPRAVLQKELRFKLLAGIESVRTIFQVLATILFAWLGYRYWSLVIGFIVSSASSTFLTLCWKRYKFEIPQLTEAKRELKFSRQIIISRIAWYAYENADFGVAGRVLGEAPLGNYTVAWNISSAPLEKIANLVTGVTPAYFSAVQTDKSELRRYLLRLTEILSFVTVPACVGLTMVADYLVPALLGTKWLGVIAPLRLLGLFVAVRSLTTFLPNLLTAIGDSAFIMWSMAASAVAMPMAFWIGSHWGTTGIAAAWLFAYPIIIAPVYYRTFEKTGTKVKEYASVLFPSINASIIMAVALFGMRSMISPKIGPLWMLSILTIGGAFTYCGALMAFHRKRVSHLITTIRATLGKR
jgi:O-antigen/teichoic acid export membrane protein